MKAKKKIRKWVGIFLGLLVAFAGWRSYAALSENLFVLGENEARNAAVTLLNDAITKTLAQVPATDLLQMEKDEKGNITMLSTDSAKMNAIAQTVVHYAQDALEKMEETPVSMPLGNAFGSTLFSGLGPKISLTSISLGVVTTKFQTEFQSMGINQTNYKVYLNVQADMGLVLGSKTRQYAVENQVLICNTILVGAVPDTYADLTQATDFLNLVP